MLDTFAPSSAIAEALVATFTTVFVAEVAGDKLIYTAGVLVTRYRLAPVIVGVTLAFGAKMAVAVVVGRAIGALPRAARAAATVGAFAWVVWQMSRETEETTTVAQAGSGARTVVVSFTSVFFTEWGDPGQRSEEHTSELQSLAYLVCRLLLAKKFETDKNWEVRCNAAWHAFLPPRP